jgi:hypothetical protein
MAGGPSLDCLHPLRQTTEIDSCELLLHCREPVSTPKACPHMGDRCAHWQTPKSLRESEKRPQVSARKQACQISYPPRYASALAECSEECCMQILPS